jgi:uncharacterized membrane protein
MRISLLKYWERIRASFWFLPTLMTIGSAVLAYIMVTTDRFYGHKLPPSLSWAYTGGAEGASAVLSTIAGSMITLAGVVFSLTLVALSLASSQFGPRLLRNFMRDTTNQVTIGTFIATFLYCLLVLRTIRRLEELTFVPQLSVTVGVVFALASLGVLIYFIHHVAVSIQADEIIARVADELSASIERIFPEQLGEEAERHSEGLPADIAIKSLQVHAIDDGYIEFVDADALMSLAKEADLVLRIERRPGQYVIAGTALLYSYPEERTTEELQRRIRRAFVLGTMRTSAQDVEFSIDQLVEIAVRALSPGVNDPFTAVTAIDRLGSALAKLAQRSMPSAHRYDERQRLRVVSPATTFPELLAAAFNQIRQHAVGSPAVAIRLLETLTVIASFARRPGALSAVAEQAEMIIAAARQASHAEGDRRDIEGRYTHLRSVMAAKT